MGRQKSDVEAGRALLWDRRECRRDFIRKVDIILFLQLLATTIFAAFVQHFACFFKNGIAICIVVLALGLVVMAPLYHSRHRVSVKIFFLVIFTLCFAFTIGIVSAFTSGKVVIETAWVTTVVVVSLTVSTFWAADRGQDFGFLYPFLLSTVVVVVLFFASQIFYPMAKALEAILSGVCAIIFCGYVVYDAGKLINDDSDDDCIWAAVRLYLDITNLFWSILYFLKKAASSDC